MREAVRYVLEGSRQLLSMIAAPLRKDSDTPSLTLSLPETQTTTVDGGIGWSQRPPARLICRRCDEQIHQSEPLDDIDCPHCVAEFDYTEFAELELAFFLCPECGDEMEHGTRHPHSLDVPEWATCHSCRYHWEFKHSFP